MLLQHLHLAKLTFSMAEKRLCFFAGEKAEAETGKEGKESKEKVDANGVPIDVDPSKKKDDKEKPKVDPDEAARLAKLAAEKAAREKAAREKAEADRIAKEKAEAEARKKEQLNAAEKKVKEKYGGEFFKLSDLPGVNNPEVKSDFHISYPEDMSKYKKPPRVIVFCHGNGGQNLDGESEKIFEEVKKMREAGEPVVLIMPSDKFNKGEPNWKDFQDPKVFGAMIKQAEQLTGQKLRNNISLTSFSGGYKAINQVLTGLQNSSDPELKEMYEGLRQIGFLESYYGGAEDALAKWAMEDPTRELQSCTGTPLTREANERLLSRVKVLMEKMGKKMEDYKINIETKNTPGGHGITPSIFAAYMKTPEAKASKVTEEKVAESTGVVETLNFPPRSPDAMTGSQFANALALCKTAKDKQQLILEQAAKGAFSPDAMQPKFYETTIDGKKVKIPLYTNLSFGTADDKLTLTPDGPTMQAIADMVGGNVPPHTLYERLYADEAVKKMPFFTGEQLEGLVNKNRREKGLPPLPINNTVTDPVTGEKKIVRNGAAMKSVDYLQAEHDMQMEWLKKHGIKPNELAIGARKTVFASRAPDKITFGGGAYATPIADDNGKPDFVLRGNIAQGIGDRAHEPNYSDYAQGGDLLGSYVEVEGKKVAMSDICTKTEYKEIRTAIFGTDADALSRRYKLDKETQQAVAAFHEKYPKGSPNMIAVSKPSEEKKPEDKPVAKIPDSPKEIALPAKGEGIPITVDSPKYAKSAPDDKPSPTYTGGAAYTPSPTYSGGAASYAGGSPSYSPKPAAEYQPVQPVSPTAQPSPSPEKPAESVEKAGKGQVFVIGDSLSDGFAPKMGLQDAKHLHYGNREKSKGQTSRQILDVLKTKILNQDCRGATLVILGGSNDIFLPGSSDQIMQNLKEIYKLAQEAGMKVVSGTLPPLAYSKYSVEWGAKYRDKFPTQEEYEQDLVKRWKEINNWIRGYKGAVSDETKKQVGPDEVIDFAAAFEDPSTPGKLKPGIRGENGDGVHFADYTEMGKLIGDKVREIQSSQAKAEPKSPDAQPAGGEKTTADVEALYAKHPEYHREAQIDSSELNDKGELDQKAYRNNPKRFPPGKTMADMGADNAAARSKVPGGYTFIYSHHQEATAQAWAILGSAAFGSATPFSVGEDQFIAIKEWHAPHTPEQGEPYHWHPGCSVMQKKKSDVAPDETKLPEPDSSQIAKANPEEDGGDKKKS